MFEIFFDEFYVDLDIWKSWGSDGEQIGFFLKYFKSFYGIIAMLWIILKLKGHYVREGNQVFQDVFSIKVF